ncbi:hypothetical protein SAMD00079811_46020 [Scytonema sp. HK-05]|uniref:hypothetical protein n=1 Tax=Scytonema sp. HK-05 TaxID=1137095 RepID=UPI000AE01CD0|nr:hypothetical protein [Scytonema sp. HK-05]BAY46986.1 hypothetical protein SAMD00079811_46020 [Scytonema sp. HK-05]
MPKIPLLEQLSLRVNFQVQELNSKVGHWILRVKSKPLTVSQKPATILTKYL